MLSGHVNATWNHVWLSRGRFEIQVRSFSNFHVPQFWPQSKHAKSKLDFITQGISFGIQQDSGAGNNRNSL